MNSLSQPLLSHRPAHQCRVVILGDTGVGKTSICVRFVRNAFREFNTTTGGTFLTQQMEFADKQSVPLRVQFNIWDTPGERKFRPITHRLYLQGALAAIVVYDVTSRRSLESAKVWIEELSGQGESMVLVLVGNKVDLVEERTDLVEEADGYAQHKDILHIETSAKTPRNVRGLFEELARSLPIPESQEPPEPCDDDATVDGNPDGSGGGDDGQEVSSFASSVRTSIRTVCSCCIKRDAGVGG